MRQSLTHLLTIVFVLISVTACASPQQTASASGPENPQGMRQWSSGVNPQEGRPTGERPSGGRRGTGEARADRDEAEASNAGSAGNSDVKTVTGTVKSIVGNEVVLIVAQKNRTAAKPDLAYASSQETVSEQQDERTPADIFAENNGGGAESAAQEETETYLIPVGMPIGNKDFTAIKAGNTLKIYLGTDPNDGSEIITAVELR